MCGVARAIAICCFLDDFFPDVGPQYGSIKPQAKPNVSDSVVLTTALVSACSLQKLYT
jgi:hypothetical protein